MALHAGYRYNRTLGGIFSLSSFLPKDSTVFKVDVTIDLVNF